MRRKFPWSIGLGAAVAVVAVVGGVTWLLDDDDASPETDSPTAATSPVGSSLPAPASASAQAAAVTRVERFWTVERVVAALDNPAPAPRVTDESEVGPASSLPSGSAPGASASAGAEGTRPVVAGPATRAARAVQRSCVQPPKKPAQIGYPYQRVCYRAPLTQNPARTSGKLIFWNDKNDDGQWTNDEFYNCTAAVATAENRSVVVTAGHCVVTPRARTPSGEPRWHKDIGFIPSYAVQDFYRAAATSQAALARFARSQVWWGLPISGSDYQVAWSPGGWSEGGHYSHDFGAVVMAPRVSGEARQPIQSVLGSQGWDMTGKSATGKVRLLGYPSAAPFTGRDLLECRSSPRPVRFASDPAPELSAGCDMTFGASGGPWLARVDRDGLGKIVSVNSHGVPAVPVMYGPRLSNLHVDSMRKAQSTPVPTG